MMEMTIQYTLVRVGSPKIGEWYQPKPEKGTEQFDFFYKCTLESETKITECGIFERKIIYKQKTNDQ